MGNWILCFVWSIVESFSSKSFLNISDLFLSLFGIILWVFFLSNGSSGGCGWSFFGVISFGRKLFWNVSSWSLHFIKRSWSWFFSIFCWLWFSKCFFLIISWFHFFFGIGCWFWISFLLVISTWIWLFVWIVPVLEIISILSIFEVKWFFKLLDTIILLVNFLWNKTSWIIWVDLLLSE